MFICDRTPGRVLARRAGGLAAWIVLLLSASAADRHPALAPAEALASFQLEPGLRIELVAAEPLVIDPVAFVFDGPGRLFVAEGRGYPDPLEGGGTTTAGRVALLEDTDGDGRFDKRTEFATGLGYVNGLALWRGGVFVTAAPDILYLKDTNGDGVADERRVVLTGFDATKTAQLRVSHPTLGLDGKMYVTSGLNGGKVTSPEHPERPAVTFSLRDGRFDPDTLEFENTGGRGQFGLTFDAFGRRFVTSNRHPVLQVMLEPWHLKRNPHLAFNDMMQEVSKVEAEAKVLRISRAAISADYIPKLMGAPHAGTFTSACGTLVFGGTGLTPEHVGNVFICEPAQNLIQRQAFHPAGASLRSDRVDSQREFLASTDVWFRPVFLGSGPDGALYVADMYRREIDHPRYVPEESRGALDFEGGKDRGRIYRIVKAGPASATTQVALTSAGISGAKPGVAPTTATLLADLESPDEWWRARAQRLLLERNDREVISRLEELARSAPRPETRTRALWTLSTLHSLTPTSVTTAFRDSDARVREQAVQLTLENGTVKSEFVQPLIAAAADSDARVRFCAALALGSVEEAAAVPALARIAARDGEDRWTRAAVLSGIGTRMAEFLAAFQAERAVNPKAFALVMEQLGRVFGAGATPDACREFLRQMLERDGELAPRISSVLGLVEGYRGRAGAKAGAQADVFTALLGGEGRAAPNVRRFFGAAAERATAETAPINERVSAAALLGYADYAFAAPTLARLLDARQPPEVQLQAVRAIERLGDVRGGTLLIAKENWARYTPQIREAVLATLTSKPKLTEPLFAALQAGTLQAAEISSTRRTQLLKHADAAVRQTAETVFKDLEGGDRMQVYRTLRDSLVTGADAAKGREVFVRVCSTCHTHSGVGGKVGPDLTGIRNQPADAILLHIVVPNYEVAPAYQTLSVATRDGRSITGWLAGETESSMTLRTAFGTEETVLRPSITSLTTSGLSLMPDGLEQTMTRDEVSALIAFLKSDN